MVLKKLTEQEENTNVTDNGIYFNGIDLTEDILSEVTDREYIADKELIVLKASEVQHEPMQWLWKGWLALGKLHILAGAPGAGKTTIAMDVAATITAGKNWPDETSPITGEVLIWSSEDSYADTLGPRLDAAGANLDKVHYATEIKEGENKIYFDPAKDLSLLESAARNMKNLKLIIIDPIVSAMSGDGHKNNEVRKCLQPIVDIAEKLGVAILGITHFSKGTQGRDPAERVNGSVAFTGVARFVWVVVKGKDKEGEEKRVLSIAKTNFSAGDGGFAYLIEEVELSNHSDILTTRVNWNGTLDGEAFDIVQSVERVDKKGSLMEAEEFIEDILQNGSMASKEFYECAASEGFKRRTIERALKSLETRGVNVETFKEGDSWYKKLSVMK